MPFIHWYPGHIAKAERKLREQIGLVDVILEVIDARIPMSSRYDDIEKLTGNKPRLLIMNKADLADPDLNFKWRNYLAEKTDFPVVLTSSSSQKDISSIVKASVGLGDSKIAQLVAKGRLPRPIRVMVVGMPNVGKSSIINKLIKTGKAITGAKAGVTRAAQWIRVNPKMELMDTPGIIPMKLDNQEKAIKLAIVNSISENAYDNIEIAEELIKIISGRYTGALQRYYKTEKDKPLTLDSIAIARHWLLPAEAPDINRCASMVLADFRHGRTGRFTLESMPEIPN